MSNVADYLRAAMWIMNQCHWGAFGINGAFISANYTHPINQVQFDDLCMRLCHSLDPELLSEDGEVPPEVQENRYDALILAGDRLNEYADKIGLTQREINEDYP